MSHHRLPILLCCAAILAAGEADVWFVGPSHTVARGELRSEPASLWDAQARTITLYAARNETVAFQIVYGGAFKQVGVEPLVLAKGKDQLPPAEFLREHFLACPVVSQFDGKNRPGDVVALDALYAKNGWPREFPSPLVPLTAKKHGAPFDVAPGRNEAVWADLHVPRDAAPGVYSGTLSTAGRTFAVSLTVWDFTLPSVSHFPHWAYIGPEEIAWAFGRNHSSLARELRPQYDSYFQLARDHRLCLTEEWGADAGYVKEQRGYWDHQTGKAFKGPYAGFGFELLQLDPNRLYPWQELKEQGWLNRAFACLVDEPGDANAYRETRELGLKVAAASNGQIRRMVTEQAEPSDPAWGSLDPGVDIYCSGGIPVDGIPGLEKRGKVTWTYNGGHAGSPYIDAPVAACRSHAWAGYVSGARVWFFWDAGYIVDKQFKWRERRKEIYATDDPTPFVTNVWETALNFDETLRNRGTYNPAWAIRLNGDGLLLYPGKEVGIDGALACLRLKAIRQGGTDYEYLYLLDKAGQGAAAAAEANGLLGTAAVGGADSKDGQQQRSVRYDGYQTTAEPWDAARIRLGKRLSAIGEARLRALIQPYDQYPNPVGHPDFHGGKRW